MADKLTSFKAQLKDHYSFDEACIIYLYAGGFYAR